MILGLLALGLAVAALIRLRQLSRQVEGLQRLVAQLASRRSPETASASPAPQAAREPPPVPAPVPAPPPPKERPAPQPRRTIKLGRGSAAPESRPHWMVWIGGISVALAGIFLVKYSIEQGLLGPAARVALACLSGLAMHGFSEWRVRKAGERHHALAALAGAGTVTLYAAVLAALHLYALIGHVPAFISLGVISVGTMVLALRHGPPLAALGMVGAYFVPVLVGGEAESIRALLIYCLIVSFTVVLIIRYVYRWWLWWGTIALGAAWSFAGLIPGSPQMLVGFYLLALALQIVYLPQLEWRSRLARHAPWLLSLVAIGQPAGPDGGTARWPDRLPLRSTLALLIVVQGICIAASEVTLQRTFLWIPFGMVVVRATKTFPRLYPLPWMVLAVQVLTLLSTGLEITLSGLEWHPSALGRELEIVFPALWATLAYGVGGYRSLTLVAPRAVAASFLVCSPLCWLALTYVLSTDRSPSLPWTLAALGLSAAYAGASRLARKRSNEVAEAWAIAGCAAAYSLAAATSLSDATLTLVLAVQVVPLAWLAVRNQEAEFSWVIKAVLAAIVLRLSINPWIGGYEDLPGWPLWTYGGATAAAFIASRIAVAQPRLRRWIEAAGAQLLVLTCWAVLRDRLYDGDILAAEYSLREAATNTALWAALGLAYRWRSQVSEHLGTVYAWASGILLLMALANYGMVLLPLNPVWGWQAVSATPVWNILLLAYGAPVALALLATRDCGQASRMAAGLVAAMAAFVFATMEVRHLWQGALDTWAHPGDGEMATYSVVWLAMAVAAVLSGGMRFGKNVYRAGMALLLLTILKVFMVDMSGLTGLLRAGSFMGLGLSLLGLSYLHSRFGKVHAVADASEA